MLKKRQTRDGRGPAVQEVLRLGFVPLVDSAPLVVARELGFFRRYGLRVLLCQIGRAHV